MAELNLKINVQYNSTGLDAMRQAFKSLKSVMRDINEPTMVGKRTVYGQMAADVNALGRAADKAVPSMDKLVSALKKFDHRSVSQSVTQLERVAEKTEAAAFRINQAQRTIGKNLQLNVAAIKSLNSEASNYAKITTADARATTADAAQQRAKTAAFAAQAKAANDAARSQIAADALALKASKSKVAEQVRDQSNFQKAMQTTANVAKSVFNAMNSAFQRIRVGVLQLAAVFRTTLVSAIRSAASAIGAFGSSAASRFASLRSQLDATGKAFIRMRDQSRDASTAFRQMWSGDALMRSGRNMMQLLNQGSMMLRQTYGQFSATEQAISRSAVAGIDPIRDPKTGKISGFTPINMEEMWDFVYKTQRGEYGNTPIRSLSTQELADAVYYLTSAIGVGPTSKVNQEGIANMVGPMAIWASATQTAPEEFIKGVLGIGQQFGFNPRDFKNQDTAKAFQGISGMVGYLANVSSMEPSDVIAAMRMVGPSSFSAYGGMDRLDPNNELYDPKMRERAMFDTFLAMFAASEVGLRGSQVGRGYQRVFSGFADPTAKTRGLIAKAEGFENSKQAYSDWLYNEEGVMDFGGNGMGILGISKFLRDFKQQNGIEEFNGLIYGLFTENATRAMAATIATMDSEVYAQLQKDLEAGNFDMAYKLLEQVMQQETALISNAVTNMQNAWGQFANSIFRTSKDQIVGGLDAIANVFRELSDIILDFPAIGQTLSKAFSVFMVGGGLIAGLLMTAGTIITVSKALRAIGISAGIVSRGFFAFLPALIHMAPLLLLIAAAVVALRTAWEHNFLGMRDTLTNVMSVLSSGDFSTLLLEFMSTEQFENLYTWFMRIRSAFTELVSGIFFNTGNTNNLGALLNTIFGDHLGVYFYQNLLDLRVALVGLRTELSGFFSDLGGDFTGRLKDIGNLIVGFMELLFLGGMSSKGKSGVSAIGEWLGLEDFNESFTKFVLDTRENLEVFGAIVSDVFTDIGDNIGKIFTKNTLAAVLSGAAGFLKGFAQGVTAAFISALKAIELVTGALAKLSGSGGQIQELIKSLTGIDTTFVKIAQAAGLLAGFFVASKFLAPILLFSTTLRQVGLAAAGMALQFASMAGGLLSAVAGFGMVGAALSIVMVVIGGVLAALYAYTAVTQGVDEANQGLLRTWTSLVEVVKNTAENIYQFGKAIAETALDIAGISSNMVTFESVGTAIGTVLSVIAYAVSGAIAAIVLFGAALYRIGSQIGPPLLNMLKQIGPAVAGVGAAIAVGLGGAALIVIELVELFTTLGTTIQLTFLAAGAAIYIAMHPMSLIVLAVAAIGIAFLAIAGDAESMSSTLAGIVSSLPEPWQAAADKIILSFARAFDFIQNGASKLGIGDGGISESFELNYLQASGKLTPKDVQRVLGLNNTLYGVYDNSNYYRAVGSSGEPVPVTDEQMQANRERMELQSKSLIDAGMIQRDASGRIFTGSLYDYSLKNPEAASKLSEQEYARLSNYSIERSIGNKIDAQNELMAVYAPNKMTNALVTNFDGSYSVLPSGKSAKEEYGNYTFRNPVQDGMVAWANRLAERNGFSPNNKNTTYSWLEEKMGVPTGTFKNEDDVARYLGMSEENLAKYSEISGKTPDDARKILAQKKAEKESNQYQQLVDTFGESEARIRWMDITGSSAVPALVGESSSFLDGVGDEMIEDAEAFSMKVAEAQGIVMEALLAQTDPYKAIGDWFDFKQGKGMAGGSAASVMSGLFDTISENVGDSPWFNQMEMMADLGGMGLLGDNMYGKNIRESMLPYFERLSQETGVGIDTLMKDIPKWTSPEPVLALVASEFAEEWNKLDTATYNKLDTLGITQGWSEFGMNWLDMVEYGASMAAAGKSWDLVGYLVDTYGVTVDEARQALKDIGVPYDAISSDWIEGSEMLVKSMTEGIAIFDESTYKAVNDLMETQGDANAKILKMSRQQFENLSDEEKRLIMNMGVTVIFTLDLAKVAQDAKKMGEEARKSVGQAIKDAMKPVEVPVPNESGTIDGQPSWTPVTGLPNTGSGDGIKQPPRKRRVIQPIDFIIEETEGVVTLKELARQDIDTLLNNAMSGALGALGNDVTRTSRTRTETVTVDLQFEFNGGSTEGIAATAQGLALSFSSAFLETLNTQLTPAITTFFAQFGAEGTTLTLTANIDQVIALLGSAHIALDVLLARVNVVTVGANIDEAIALIGSVHTALDALASRITFTSVYVADYASSTLSTIESALGRLNGMVANVGVNISVKGSLSGLVPGFAKGGIVAGSEYQIVGEEGPELVKLPWGSRVFPHAQSMDMMQREISLPQRRQTEISDRVLVLPTSETRSSGTQQPTSLTVSFGDVTVRNDQDIERIVEKVEEAISKKTGFALRGQTSVDPRIYID